MVIPDEVREAFAQFSTHANKGDRGTHPYDQDRFYKAVLTAYDHDCEMEFPDFDQLLQSQDWTNAETRRELSTKFTAAFDMLRYERTGSTFNRNG